MLRFLIIFVVFFYFPKAFAFEILKFNGKVEYSFDFSANNFLSIAPDESSLSNIECLFMISSTAKILNAKIKENNFPSKKTFEGIGFKLSYKNNNVCVYELNLD